MPAAKLRSGNQRMRGQLGHLLSLRIGFGYSGCRTYRPWD